MAEGLNLDKIRDFLETGKGKAAVVGVAAILLIAIGSAAYLMLAGGSSKDVQPTGPVAKQPASKAGSVATGTPEPMEPPVAVDSYAQEQFRDPFKPIEETTAGVVPGYPNPVQPVAPGQAGAPVNPPSSPPEGPPESPPAPPAPARPPSLKLISIYVSDGARVALMSYGDTQYRVKVGDRIDGSSYQVVEIEDGTVTLLFGDDRIVLSVGESITK